MSQHMRTWVNGIEATQVSVYDRGLQFGDGVFETMRMVDGEIKFWSNHLARLQTGCQQLRILLDGSELEKQLATIREQVSVGVIKLIVTRGESLRGYKVDGGNQSNIIWLCSDLPEFPSHYYTGGVDVCLCDTTLSCNPRLAGIKHLNRLENVLARMEWQDEYQEGLMFDSQSHIIEGTMTNVFFLAADSLITPDISHCGVAGITRQRLLDIANDNGIKTAVKEVSLNELEFFKSVLLTNSLIGAWPVKTINTQSYTVSPLAQYLVEQLQEYMN